MATRNIFNAILIVSASCELVACAPENIDIKKMHEIVKIDPSPSNGAAVSSGFKGTCVLKPEKLVKMKAQIGGEVSSVLVSQGDGIKKGQVLATLNTVGLRFRRERSQIDLNKLIRRAEFLRYQITKTEKEVQVVQEISGRKDNFFPVYGKEMAALVEKRSDLDENLLNQEAAQIDLRNLDDQIRKASVHAPFDGVVLSRTVEPGMVIGSVIENSGGGDILFEVADPSRLIASCLAKESDALLLAAGKKSSLKIDGFSYGEILGRVNRISPVISNEAGISRREFVVEFESKRFPSLLSGMNATVLIN